MKQKNKRFYRRLLSSKTLDIMALVFYLLYLFTYIVSDLPSLLELPIMIIQLIIFTVFFVIFQLKILNTISNNIDTLFQKIWEKIKKISKEIEMYIIFSLISNFILSFFIVGVPSNQTSVVESFNHSPIYYAIIIVIIGPILEEFVFRYLPYRFIKNKVAYVLISSVIFAGMHVIHDPKALYYIFVYLPDALYFGYRYYKTKDMFITFSIHSFGNLVAIILIAFF